LPPDEFCFGASRRNAANSRGPENAPASWTLAAIAEAVERRALGCIALTRIAASTASNFGSPSQTTLCEWSGRAHDHTTKDATVKRYIRTIMASCAPICATSSTRTVWPGGPRTLDGLTPYKFMCKCWTSDPKRFSLDPHHNTGLNT